MAKSRFGLDGLYTQRLKYKCTIFSMAAVGLLCSVDPAPNFSMNWSVKFLHQRCPTSSIRIHEYLLGLVLDETAGYSS